jgi:chromosome segregation ATPase
MGEMIMTDKAEVERAIRERDQAVEAQAKMSRQITVLGEDRDRALSAVNNAKLEIERLRKAVPPDQLQKENKTLRDDIAEAHRKIAVLEKELASERDASLVRQKEVISAQRRAEAVQSTFYTFQNARDQAQTDRNKALTDLQTAVEIQAKLREEFEAFKKFVQETKVKLAQKPVLEVKARA